MKYLKYLIPVFAFGLMTSMSALQAADESTRRGKGGKGGRGGQNPERMVARLDRQVGGLTDEQKTKITKIVTATFAKARDAEPQERRSILQGQRDQIRAVLTTEQQAKFDEMGARGKGRDRGKGKGRKGQKNE